MLPLSKAQAWLAHSIIIPREASENVEGVVRMTIATKECHIPKLISQRKSEGQNAKTGNFRTVLLPVGQDAFGLWTLSLI